ncbi:MAG TPA: transporter substrate-binding domain-containing protein [Vicinamibacterales bacterium]|nr:transporter substrate-binding domain-containing protein [Vicinamibacterales bacterium]
MKSHRFSCLAVVALWCLALAALPGAGAIQQQPPAKPDPPAKPAGGYEDPEGIPRRPPTPDIAPVFRGPSIDTLATIRKRGVLRVGVSSSEPMVMHDSKGELVGFSIDVGRMLAQDLGVELEFVESSWSHIIADLLDNHFDVIASGLWVTPARALVVNYTDPTATEGIYLIAAKAMTASFKTREDFNRPEVRLAVYAGTVQEGVASRLFPRATLVKAEGEELELSPVLEGKAHAVLVPTFAPRVIVQSAPDKLFLPFEEPLQQTISAMAVRKGDPDFLNYLNAWIRFHRDNAWIDERIRHWSEWAGEAK